MFEPRDAPLLPHAQWRARVLRSVAAALLTIGAALGVGVLGYRFLAGLPWIDALLNASMILGGMGPVDPLPNDSAKIFASIYALVSGLLFVGVAGLLLLPWAHRLLHRFHADPDEDDRDPPADDAPRPRPTPRAAGTAAAKTRRRR